MISGNIKLHGKYNLCTPKFETAFAFLKREDLDTLPEGWVELENGVRASVQFYQTMPSAQLRFETHEKYFDIQYMVRGEEWLGYVSREKLIVETPYDTKADVTFYQTSAAVGGVYLRAGEYAVLAPEDAHQPRCIARSAMPVVKIVVKVPV